VGELRKAVGSDAESLVVFVHGLMEAERRRQPEAVYGFLRHMPIARIRRSGGKRRAWLKKIRREQREQEIRLQAQGRGHVMLPKKGWAQPWKGPPTPGRPRQVSYWGVVWLLKAYFKRVVGQPRHGPLIARLLEGNRLSDHCRAGRWGSGVARAGWHVAVPLHRGCHMESADRSRECHDSQPSSGSGLVAGREGVWSLGGQAPPDRSRMGEGRSRHRWAGVSVGEDVGWRSGQRRQDDRGDEPGWSLSEWRESVRGGGDGGERSRMGERLVRADVLSTICHAEPPRTGQWGAEGRAWRVVVRRPV
jgi:hypothetical protein